MFSDMLGEEIAELPEQRRDAAANDYAKYLDRIRKRLADYQDMDIYDVATKLEVGLADLYEEDNPPTLAEKEKLHDEILAGEVGSIVDKEFGLPFGAEKLFYSPVRDFFGLEIDERDKFLPRSEISNGEFQEGATAGNGAWIYRNGDWVENK